MFQTSYIKVDDEGIDILRSFQYDLHFNYNEIYGVKIKRGFISTNWFPMLILGNLLTFISVISILEKSIDTKFFTSEGVRFSLLLQFIPLFVLVSCVMLIFFSLRRSTIIIILTEFERFRIPLKALDKENRINELIEFLKDKVDISVTLKTNA
jgi:hypothetical protein